MAYALYNLTSSTLYFTNGPKITPGHLGYTDEVTQEMLLMRAQSRLTISPFTASEVYVVRNIVDRNVINDIGDILRPGETTAHYGLQSVGSWIPSFLTGNVTINPPPSVAPPAVAGDPSPPLQNILLATAGPVTVDPTTYQAARIDTSGGNVPLILGTPAASEGNRITIKNLGVNLVLVSAELGQTLDGVLSVSIAAYESYDFLYVAASNTWLIV
jgi:hypothetical protein